jgi:hypothetical protein
MLVTFFVQLALLATALAAPGFKLAKRQSAGQVDRISRRQATRSSVVQMASRTRPRRAEVSALPE